MNSPRMRFTTRRGFIAGGIASIAATLSLAACANKSASQAPASPKLAIVHTNDTHGHDLLNDESLGLSAVAQLKQDYEAKGYEVLLLDSGDAVQGENLVNRSKGDAAIDFMNLCGYHAMALGNHEFDYGQGKIEDYAAQADFPLLSSNTIVEATGEPLVEPRTIFTLADGTKVGVFGLTTPETYTKASPLLVQGLTMLQGDELYANAQEQVDALRAEGCTLVICLAHLGESEESAPNRAMDVVAHTTGIDLVINGHDHQEEDQLLADANGADVLVVETGCFTHAVGVVTWEGGTPTSNLQAFGSYAGQDAAVAAHIQELADELNAQLDEVVATTEYLLDGETVPGVRTRETNLGDLVSDAVLWEALQMADDTPDCAIINGGSIRESIEVGDITLGKVLNVLPFLNYVCTIQVTGAQLLEAIEASCAATPEEMGGFPQVSNMTYTVDTRTAYTPAGSYPESTFEAPATPGSRVTIHTVGKRDFSLKDSYTIAASDFMCIGGDTYYAFTQAAQRSMKGINYLVSDCLRYYLEEACGGVVPNQYANAAGDGRIEVIGT